MTTSGCLNCTVFLQPNKGNTHSLLASQGPHTTTWRLVGNFNIKDSFLPYLLPPLTFSLNAFLSSVRGCLFLCVVLSFRGILLSSATALRFEGCICRQLMNPGSGCGSRGLVNTSVQQALCITMCPQAEAVGKTSIGSLNGFQSNGGTLGQKNDRIPGKLPSWIWLRGISQAAGVLKITLVLRNSSFQELRDIESLHSSAVQQKGSTACVATCPDHRK